MSMCDKTYDHECTRNTTTLCNLCWPYTRAAVCNIAVEGYRPCMHAHGAYSIAAARNWAQTVHTVLQF